MIGRLLGIAGALLIAGWLYWLTARVQLLLSQAEQALEKADRILADAMLQAGLLPVLAGAAGSPGVGGSTTAPEPATAPEPVRSDTATMPAVAPPPTAVPQPRVDPPGPVPEPEAAPAPLAPEPVSGPPTAPQGIVIEAQKRALVERAFSVDGQPHTFKFRAVRR
jgi:hypothetical protein